MHGSNRAGKCALTSHSGISVTDKNKRTEQINSDRTLYEQAELEEI